MEPGKENQDDMGRWADHMGPRHVRLCLGLVQFSSGAQLCPTLCDPMNHSTLGLPVHHQLLELTQTRVH